MCEFLDHAREQKGTYVNKNITFDFCPPPPPLPPPKCTNMAAVCNVSGASLLIYEICQWAQNLYSLNLSRKSKLEP